MQKRNQVFRKLLILLRFLFQHMHNKTINVKDIKDTITLKKSARKCLFGCLLFLNGFSVRAFCMLKAHNNKGVCLQKKLMK